MEIQRGDIIKIGELQAEVEEIVYEYGQCFAQTKYGNFNLDIVELIKPQSK